MKQLEHNLQVSCVRWFDLQFPHLKPILFAIPNGGQRNKTVAAKLKAEGVRSGVADLFLSMPSKSHHGLYIEMKSGKNKQTDTQLQFQKLTTEQGYRYEVIRTFEQFKDLIVNYIYERQ